MDPFDFNIFLKLFSVARKLLFIYFYSFTEKKIFSYNGLLPVGQSSSFCILISGLLKKKYCIHNPTNHSPHQMPLACICFSVHCNSSCVFVRMFSGFVYFPVLITVCLVVVVFFTAIKRWIENIIQIIYTRRKWIGFFYTKQWFKYELNAIKFQGKNGKMYSVYGAHNVLSDRKKFKIIAKNRKIRFSLNVSLLFPCYCSMCICICVFLLFSIYYQPSWLFSAPPP